jgi:hypothetical protein
VELMKAGWVEEIGDWWWSVVVVVVKASTAISSARELFVSGVF